MQDDCCWERQETVGVDEDSVWTCSGCPPEHSLRDFGGCPVLPRTRTAVGASRFELLRILHYFAVDGVGVGSEGGGSLSQSPLQHSSMSSSSSTTTISGSKPG